MRAPRRPAAGSCRRATAASARYFDAAAAQTGGNGIQIDLTSSAPENPTAYFGGPVTVTATGPAGVALFRRLDDGQEMLYTGPFVVSADGPHTVEFRGEDESTGVRSFVIDATNPLAPVIFTPPLPAPAMYTLGQVVDADYRCRDSGSGIATCTGAVGGTPVPSGTPLPTNAVGIKTLSVTGTDLTGHVGPTATRQYQVVWAFDGFLPPVDNLPVLNMVTAGHSVPVKFSLGGLRPQHPGCGLAVVRQGRVLVHGDPGRDRNDHDGQQRPVVQRRPVHVRVEDGEVVEGPVPPLHADTDRRNDARR